MTVTDTPNPWQPEHPEGPFEPTPVPPEPIEPFDDELDDGPEPDPADVAQAARTRNLVDGLRKLAAEVEARPELGALIVPDAWSNLRVAQYFYAEDDFRRAVRALGGIRDKNPVGAYMEITRRFGDHVVVELNVHRDEVCDAVEVGRETVTIPDPEAPKVEVDRPIIEWRCRPILDDEAASTTTTEGQPA